MDYKNGKIYSIRSYQTDQIYIGSTIQSLSKRLYGHKRSFKIKKYITSFEILKYDDFYIELVELYPCTCKDELHRREGEIIRSLDNCVNIKVPGRTRKEYRSDNKDKLLEKHKQYRSLNKDKISKKKKIYRSLNKDKISERRKIKITCECGTIHRKSDIRMHERSNKHFDYMNIYVV